MQAVPRRLQGKRRTRLHNAPSQSDYSQQRHGKSGPSINQPWLLTAKLVDPTFNLVAGLKVH